MKLFVVVTERDGATVKAPGVSETEIKRVNRRYVAQTIQQVWDATVDIRNDPEETFIGIVEEHSAVEVLK